MKLDLINIFAAFRICIVPCVLTLLGCPYIDHGTSKTPDLVTAENVQGCYYSEQTGKDKFLDKNLPGEDDFGSKGRYRDYDKLFCKKLCFEGDSVVVNVRGFAMPYDTTGQYIEDTIPYKIRRTYITNEMTEYGLAQVYHTSDLDETIYEEKFPVLFMEPAVDGIFTISIQAYFPTDISTEYELYQNAFKMNVSFDHQGKFTRENGYKNITISTYYHKEVFSTKGWGVCKGF